MMQRASRPSRWESCLAWASCSHALYANCRKFKPRKVLSRCCSLGGITVVEGLQAGAEALFGMGPVGQDGDDEPLGVGADRSTPAPKAFGRPLGVAPMRAGHVIGIGAMPTPAMTTLVSGDALAPVEQLDRPGRGADIDLLAIRPRGTE